MSQLQYISGIPKPVDPFRIDDSPRSKTRKRFMNWTGKSEGEFELELLLDSVLIDEAYYGDAEGHYQKAKNMLSNALRSGLHTGLGVTSFGAVPKSLNSIASAIRKAKVKTRSSSMFIQGDLVRGPFDPFGNNPFSIDCTALFERKTELQNQITNAQNTGLPQTVVNSLLGELAELEEILTACTNHQQQINLLNDKFEESANDYTYNYLTPVERNSETPSIVSQKASIQQNYLQRMANLSGLSYNNLSLWGDNGIKRNNTGSGTQPWTGRETAWGVGYATLDGDVSSIGIVVEIATVIAISKAAVALLGAITAAIIAAKSLKNNQSPSDQFQLTNLLGSEPGNIGFDPSIQDWQGFVLPYVDGNGNPVDPPASGGSTGSSDTGNTGLLIGGAALLGGLLLLNQNDK